MTPHAKKVLSCLYEARDESEDFWFCSFRQIEGKIGLDRRPVRLACRYLTRKGFAQFMSGLWTEDGMPAGSGYGITQAGIKEHERINA